MRKYARPRTKSHPNFPLKNPLEDAVAEQIRQKLDPSKPLAYWYEKETIQYDLPPAVYKPDFLLPNGVIIEVKGFFESEDRTKHLLLREQHPELDVRFIFSNSKMKIAPGSKTSYGDWCLKHGFLFSDRKIPEAWFSDPLI